MTRSPSACPLGPEFGPFLFAPIGVDPNGMPLSVLSALARMDVDPWQEAARLTELPAATATLALEALLAERTDGDPTDAGAGATAARLIALLPRKDGSGTPKRRSVPQTEATAGSQATLPVLLFLILMALMLGAEALVASRRPPASIDHVQSPTSTTALPRTASAARRPVTIHRIVQRSNP